MTIDDLKQKFLEDRDETGRMIVTSIRTGKVYAIEPIGGNNVEWGSIDITTGYSEKSFLINKKGYRKYRGAIRNDKDSLITEENGFSNITTLNPGYSPFAYIDEIDSKYPDKGES